MINQEQIKEIQSRLETLKECLNVTSKRKEIEELTEKTLHPDFWNFPKCAESILKKKSKIEFWINKYDRLKSLVDDLLVFFEFEAPEVDQIYTTLLTDLETLELCNMLGEEDDNLSAVLTINSGAGGTEAQDWSVMLMRMYMRWAERNGYVVTITDQLDGEDAGIKSVTMQIEGDYAFGYLKAESGVHRLVRISPFNAQGKRQTSFASVFVYPLVDDSIEIEINLGDLEWDTFRSSGAGGQNVNKVESGVRLHYKFINPLTNQPDEIVIENTETRDQPKNRENALRHLRSQLYGLELEKRRQAQAKMEAGKKKIEWGSQIRSYVLHPYKMVKDLRTGHETFDTQGVLDGDLNDFMKEFLMKN